MTKKDDQRQRNKEILYSALRLQKHSKKSLLAVMQSFAESTDSVDTNYANEIKEFLENLKKSLELCNENISTLEELTKSIDKAFTYNSALDANATDDNISLQSESKVDNSTTNSKESVDSLYSAKDIENIDGSKQNNNIKPEGNNYVENTLIISETTGNVILPYELDTLKQELKNTDNTYSSIDEIIKNEYSLPISLFKNPFIARFRESYKLMRNREKSSIKEAFDLGLELMFNYNLHPAIISACKNLDELDIYLDYLDSNETSKFKYFKVLFEIAPTVVKSKHSF